MEPQTTVSFPYQRIVVIGVTGCGKSMLAEKLARKLGLEFIDLDALFWKPNWVESSDEEFRPKVEAATRGPAWALAGNYNRMREIIWPRAEAVVWLDYSYPLVFGRLWKRTWQRWRSQEALWGTNTERLLPQFKLWSKESLFNWQAQSYGRFKRRYEQLTVRPENTHLKVFRFKKPEETERWVGEIGGMGGRR
jgi:adenylate kinase family enzyme